MSDKNDLYQTHLVIFLGTGSSSLSNFSSGSEASGAASTNPQFTLLIDKIESSDASISNSHISTGFTQEESAPDDPHSAKRLQVQVACLSPVIPATATTSVKDACTDLVEGIMSKIIAFKASYISFVGLGVGGIYARYLVGMLNERGVFYLVNPAHFITIDTPHLGHVLADDGTVSSKQGDQQQHQSSFFSSLFSSLSLNLNVNLNVVGGQGGKQGIQADLMLEAPSKNESPLLLKLCEPFFLNPLKLFQQRTLFSLVDQDIGSKSNGVSLNLKRQSSRKNSQNYQTSSITRADFPLTTIESTSSMPSLIVDNRQTTEPEEEDGVDDQAELDPKTMTPYQLQLLIHSKLAQLDWQRLAILPNVSSAKSPTPQPVPLEIYDPKFWGTKQSNPLISTLSLLLSSINTPPVIPTPTLDSMTNTLSSSSPPQNRSKHPLHIVVLIHGLDGFDTDLLFLSQKLAQRYKHVHPFAPTVNHGKTYDGILKGATRVYHALVAELRRLKDLGLDVSYISVIGHSLGGLYGRCLIYLLKTEGIIPNILKPLNYISLATPHLGSRQHSKWVGEKMTSLVLGSFIGMTGSELMLADEGGSGGIPFIVEMSKEKYLEALELFPTRLVYSNVRYDVPVHYSTASIRLTPFQAPASAISNGGGPAYYPLVFFDSKEEPIPVEQENESWEATMLRNLTSRLTWKRYAVITDRPLLAHIDIIIKNSFWNRHGLPIIAHVVDHFRHVGKQQHKNTQTFDAGTDSTIAASAGSSSSNGVHLVIVLHGKGKSVRDLHPLIENLRDVYPRPLYKIIAPEYPETLPNQTNSTTVPESELERLICGWLVGWAESQISHSGVNRVSLIGQGMGALYALHFLRKFFQDSQSTIQENNIQFGSLVCIDAPFSLMPSLWVGKTEGGLDVEEAEGQGNIDFLVNCLKTFQKLALYSCTTDPQCPASAALLLSGEECDFLSSGLGRDDQHWRIVHYDKHRNRQKSIDMLASTTSVSTSSSSSIPPVSGTKRAVKLEGVAGLQWVRFLILPPKSSSNSSFFYWNNEHQNHLIAHIASFWSAR